MTPGVREMRSVSRAGLSRGDPRVRLGSGDGLQGDGGPREGRPGRAAARGGATSRAPLRPLARSDPPSLLQRRARAGRPEAGRGALVEAAGSRRCRDRRRQGAGWARPRDRGARRRGSPRGPRAHPRGHGRRAARRERQPAGRKPEGLGSGLPGPHPPRVRGSGAGPADRRTGRAGGSRPRRRRRDRPARTPRP